MGIVRIDTGDAQNWVPIRAAAARLGLSYPQTWRLVDAGHFTRGAVSDALKSPPVFLRADEVRAYTRGGLGGLKVFRERASKRRAKG